MPAPDPSADQARAAIQTALGQIGFALPGTITIRRARCGKPRCACAADPPALHGPYIQWTRTVHGKTVTRLLSPAQYQAYAPWFASARPLRALTAELQALSLAEMARAEGWATITPGTPAPPRTCPVLWPEPKLPQNHPKRREISPLNPESPPQNTRTRRSLQFCRRPIQTGGNFPQNRHHSNTRPGACWRGRPAPPCGEAAMTAPLIAPLIPPRARPRRPGARQDGDGPPPARRRRAGRPGGPG